MSEFDSIYERMSSNLDEMDIVLGEAFSQVLNSPDNSDLYSMFEHLAYAYHQQIDALRNFVLEYCNNRELSDMLISKLDSREKSLNDGMEKSNLQRGSLLNTIDDMNIMEVESKIESQSSGRLRF